MTRFECSARLVVVSLGLATILPGVASAQSPPPQPASSQLEFLGVSFAQAYQGREVWITAAGGPRFKARVGTVGADGLTVNPANGQPRTIRFPEISKVEKVTHRLRNHTLTGLVIGSGLGLVGLFACDDDAACAAEAFLFYGGIGAGIGALNGAIRNSLNRDDDLIYQAAARTTTFAVTPIVSPTRKGVAFSMGWR
jgi:hypothetical protein